MEEIIAYCGLFCHECGAFQAPRDNDNEKRALVAQKWSKEFKADLKPEDINCTYRIFEMPFNVLIIKRLLAS